MLHLRPYKKCDAKYIISWIKDEMTFRKWSADRYDHYPITEDELNRAYEEVAYVDNYFPMTIFDDSTVVGHLMMRYTDEEKKILRFGFVIVDDTKRGQGYGKEMLQLALDYAFNILKVEMVSLGVFDNNVQAYHCYKSVGFLEVELDKPEIYHILGEEWECIELAIVNHALL